MRSATCGASDCTTCVLSGLNRTTAIRRSSVPRPTLASIGVRGHAGTMSALQLALLYAAKTALAEPSSLWLEFGVWRGGSTRQLFDGRRTLLQDRWDNASTLIFGFDSFQGLPEDWRAPTAHQHNAERIGNRYLRKGAFSLYGKPPFEQRGIDWVPGWFNETLPGFLDRHAGSDVTLVHIDADLYTSAHTVLTTLWRERRLHPGALLVFDELINYPQYASGELKALCDLLELSGRSVQVLGTAASMVLSDATAIAAAIRKQHWGRETPHAGAYRQDAAFVLR